MPLDVVSEHVELRTGGTCFSLTHCFRQILESQGFRTSAAMADMPSGPDLHCALVVSLDDRRLLVDPGFLLPGPVPLPEETETRAEGAAGPVILRRHRGGVSLLTSNRKGEKFRYTLKDRPVSDEAFLDHWKRSFDLPLLNSILISASSSRGHLYLHNNHFRVTRGDDVSRERVRSAYGRRVQSVFGLQEELTEKAMRILEATGRSRLKR